MYFYLELYLRRSLNIFFKPQIEIVKFNIIVKMSFLRSEHVTLNPEGTRIENMFIILPIIFHKSIH